MGVRDSQPRIPRLPWLTFSIVDSGSPHSVRRQKGTGARGEKATPTVDGELSASLHIRSVLRELSGARPARLGREAGLSSMYCVGMLTRYAFGSGKSCPRRLHPIGHRTDHPWAAVALPHLLPSSPSPPRAPRNSTNGHSSAVPTKVPGRGFLSTALPTHKVQPGDSISPFRFHARHGQLLPIAQSTISTCRKCNSPIPYHRAGLNQIGGSTLPSVRHETGVSQATTRLMPHQSQQPALPDFFNKFAED